MVQLSKYIMRTAPGQSNPLPMLNSLFLESQSFMGSLNSTQSFKTFMQWARKSPHLIGLLRAITNDVVSDSTTFKSREKSLTNSKNKIQRAETFWRVNKGRDILEETMIDALITGQGYNWIGKLADTDIKELAKRLEVIFPPNKETKENRIKQVYEIITEGDSKANLIKKFRHIASSTISVKNNQYEITDFIQNVGTYTKVFSPDEIIHIKLMPFDGSPIGFPPMEALLSEIYLLWLITQEYVAFFDNGGHPDKVFILPKEIAGSKNHDYLIETLKKYKKVQNKHGNLVFTGEMTVEDLQKVEDAMQHKDLGLYLVGVLALIYNVPAGRIPFLIGKAANLGDAGGLADSGYWRGISVIQSKIEDAYNSGIFNRYFDVDIVFSRGYMQDEVREVGIELQKTQVAQQRITLGLWDEYAAADYLNIDPEEIEKAMQRKKERDAELAMQNSGLSGRETPNSPNMINEPDKKLKNKVKQDTQINNNVNSGGKRINP